MNETLKTVLKVGTGFVVGGLVGYLTAKKLLEKKYSDICDSEVESMREMYDRKAEKLRCELSAQNNESIKRDISSKLGCPEAIMDDRSEEEESEETEENLKSGPREVGLIRRYGGDQVNEAAGGYKFKKDIIDEDLFSNDRSFDKIDLDYYEGDEVLVEAGEIADIGSTIGFDALDHFGETGEEDVVYVRNLRIGTDFAVFRHHECFYWPGEDVSPDDE